MSSLVLTGNNYSALNTIQIVNVPGTSFTGQQGILEINSPVTLNSPIIIDTKTVSAATLNGTLNINADVVLTNTLNVRSSIRSLNINIREGKSLTLTKNNALIGPGTFSFSMGKNSILNINGNDITINNVTTIINSTLNIHGSGTKITGKLYLRNPIINLELNQLNLDDNVTFYNNSNMTLITKHQGDSGGHIMVTGGNLDLSKLDSLIITPIVN